MRRKYCSLKSSRVNQRKHISFSSSLIPTKTRRSQSFSLETWLIMKQFFLMRVPFRHARLNLISIFFPLIRRSYPAVAEWADSTVYACCLKSLLTKLSPNAPFCLGGHMDIPFKGCVYPRVLNISGDILLKGSIGEDISKTCCAQPQRQLPPPL